MGTYEHQRHLFAADEFQRLHIKIIQMDQTLQFLIVKAPAQSGKIVYLEKNAFPVRFDLTFGQLKTEFFLSQIFPDNLILSYKYSLIY